MLVKQVGWTRKEPWHHAPKVPRGSLGCFLSCLEGTMFTIKTDRHSFQRILNHSDAADKFPRWHYWPMEFDFELIYRAVLIQELVGALSRLSTNRTDYRDIDDEIVVLAIQQQSRSEKQYLTYCCQDSDDTTVIFESQLIMTAKADDVRLPSIADFVLAQGKTHSASRWYK